MRVKATKTVDYEIGVQHQERDDLDDGQRAGYWAWVGPPGNQSDFCVGPFKTAKAARVGACERLRRMGYDLVEKAR